MSQPTRSEMLFERFCRDLQILLQKIPTSGKPTPDYDIVLAGHKLLVEVKQLEPNDRDEETLAEARLTGSAAAWSNSDNRVRAKINEANTQLKERSKGTLPAMSVVFDNGTFSGIDRDDMKTAMFGDETVVVSRSSTATIVSPIHAGGNRRCSPTYNTTTSAVGLLIPFEGSARLAVFHNHFAAIPIDPDWLRHERFLHFGLDPAIYEWRPL